ncbi:MAG: hypothetical protein ABW175_11025, partial [Bradyrhizobium sp.]
MTEDTQGVAERAARELLAGWESAFCNHDVERIVSLYSPKALFLGTYCKSGIVGRDGIRQYFTDNLLNNRPRWARYDEIFSRTLSPDAAFI